jgi:peptide/nickel transport system substrate-binding protein
LGRSGQEPINMIAGVDAPDPRTVVFRWRGAYTEAGVLESVVSSGAPSSGPSFAPLPRHVLERIYQDERETFLTSSYWTTDFVGSGPYRLDRWEPGAFVEAAAFDGHALGRPKIDRVRLIWNADASVVLANLLSGDAHLSIDDSIKISEGIVLQREWSSRGAGQVRFFPKNWRHLDFQLRPEYVSPRAALDTRVRRAIAHSIDKDAINEGLFQGVGLPTISMMYPSVPYHADLERVATRYPLDPQRAEALMQEAGYRRGGDGFYEGADGRLQFQIKGTSSPENAAERTILAAGWRQAGFETEEGSFTPAETGDGQAVATFRSMYSTGAPAGLPAIGLFMSANIPRPENRWVGSNRGGWSSPEYDRLAEAVQSTLDPPQRAQRVVEAVKVFTEQIGSVSLYFNPSVSTVPAAVRGMNVAAPEAEPIWNIYQWEL